MGVDFSWLAQTFDSSNTNNNKEKAEPFRKGYPKSCVKNNLRP
jgi:hypothetical protein